MFLIPKTYFISCIYHCEQGRFGKYGGEHSDSDNVIVISMYKWHTGSRWYTLDFGVATADIYTLLKKAAPRQTAVCAIGVKCL